MSYHILKRGDVDFRPLNKTPISIHCVNALFSQPEYKCIILGNPFRPAKELFSQCEEFIMEYDHPDCKIIKRADSLRVHLNKSTISAMHVGLDNGDKIKGFRAHDIVVNSDLLANRELVTEIVLGWYVNP